MTTEVIYRLHDVGVKGQGHIFMADNANSSFYRWMVFILAHWLLIVFRCKSRFRVNHMATELKVNVKYIKLFYGL